MTPEQNGRQAFAPPLPPDGRSPKKPDQNQDAGDYSTVRAELKFELELIERPGMSEILLDIRLVPLFDLPEDYSKDGIGNTRRRLLKNIRTERNTSATREQKLTSPHGFPTDQRIYPRKPPRWPGTRNTGSTLGTKCPSTAHLLQTRPCWDNRDARSDPA